MHTFVQIPTRVKENTASTVIAAPVRARSRLRLHTFVRTASDFLPTSQPNSRFFCPSRPSRSLHRSHASQSHDRGHGDPRPSPDGRPSFTRRRDRTSPRDRHGRRIAHIDGVYAARIANVLLARSPSEGTLD